MGKLFLSRPLLAGVITFLFGVGVASAQADTTADTGGTDLNPASHTSSPSLEIKPVPVPPENGFFRKPASQTPSGFKVPRYVSLKFGKVNGRTGPSRDHSIAWQYQRRGLPLVVVAETEMWRKVRDINGDEAWVRKPALSGERFVMAMKDFVLLSKPKEGSDAVARSETGALFRLEECNDEGWCRVKANNGLKGWVSRSQLWGAQIL